MGLYQPTVISPSQLNGTGVIDATQDMTVTWQINGTIPIYGWQFVIMQNDADSTVLYTSDWRHDYITVQGEQIAVYTYGRDGEGNPVPKSDTITAADLANAGVTNNYTNGYKLRVNQQYDVYENPNESHASTRLVLEQISPVYFMAMESTTFYTDSWSDTYGRYAFFTLAVNDTANHIPHISFDPLVTNRWQLALADDPDDNILEDTGNIYLANSSSKIYGILDNGKSYAVRLTGKLESGIELDTDWHTFTASWTDTALDYVHLKAYYVKDQPAIFVRLEVDDGYDESVITSADAGRGWEIYRIRADTGEREKAGVIPRGQTAMYDFGVRNNTAYYYRAYYGLGAYDGYCYETETPIKMRNYWNWAIIETKKKSASYYWTTTHPYTNYTYNVVRVHQFQGNVVSGGVSNENSPYVENNFTPYPTLQKMARKGLSGKLQAWVGMVKNTKFVDSVNMVDKIMEMSTNDTVKFLRDRKGNLRRIEISEPIVKTTQDKYAEQPVAVEIPWVEVGDASECQVVSMLNDGVIATGDDIIDTATTISVDDDGYVIWAYEEDGYVGSTIDMNDSGVLEQTYDNGMNYVPATLTIDDDGKLQAESVVDENNG